MKPGELIVILALTGYAIYRQTRRHEVVGSSRFTLAVVYAIIGLAVGGFNLPRNGLSITFLLVSVALSLVVGYVRGRLTRVWRDGSQVYSQGTPLTVGLFLALIAAKFGLGTLAYFEHISNDGGIGEVLIMIAVMVAVQAQLIWQRAQILGAPGNTAGSHAPA